jgi:uncharacterized membrane protein required for colicin V production
VGTITDTLLCVLALCFVISGFQMGFVRSIVELVGYVFAVIAAFIFSDQVAGILGDGLKTLTPVAELNHIILKIISMFLIFVVLQMLVRVISGALNTVCKLPILHQVNFLLGGVFGLAKGVLIVFWICMILKLALPLIAPKYPDINKEISHSNIYKYMCTVNPSVLLNHTEI